jgi:HAAS
VSESAIGNYLAQLDRELRVKRAPRRRLLAEAADHLRTSAEEIVATGVEARAAEEEAIARFGAAALVARRFAHAVATRSARIALVWAASACASYAVAAGFFVLRGPSWLRDFPQGAPSMLALQVALVALLLTGIRAFRFRRALMIDELRLRVLANGVAIASGVLAIAAGAEFVLALTRPAAAPWSDVTDVIGVYAVAAATTLAASFVAVGSVARASVVAVLPRESGDELPPAIAALVEDVAAAAPPLRPAVVLLTSRPVVACAATAAVVFIAMTAIAAGGGNAGGLAGAAATGLVEAAAVVIAYLALGRALGLRAPRRGSAG